MKRTLLLIAALAVGGISASAADGPDYPISHTVTNAQGQPAWVVEFSAADRGSEVAILRKNGPGGFHFFRGAESDALAVCAEFLRMVARAESKGITADLTQAVSAGPKKMQGVYQFVCSGGRYFLEPDGRLTPAEIKEIVPIIRNLNVYEREALRARRI